MIKDAFTVDHLSILYEINYNESLRDNCVCCIISFVVLLRAFIMHDDLIQHEHERTSILYHIHHIYVCIYIYVNSSLSQIGNF